MANKNAPVCGICGATGCGVQFKILSKYGFGQLCADCEESMAAGGVSPEVLKEAGVIR